MLEKTYCGTGAEHLGITNSKETLRLDLLQE